MDYQIATLNGIRGKGYVQVLGTGAGRKRCDGVFLMRPETAQNGGMAAVGRRGVFSGVVYETGEVQRLDVEVLITGVRQRNRRETVVHFMTFLSADAAPEQALSRRRSA